MIINKGQPWAPEDLKQLQQLVADGKDWDQCAVELGRSAASCKSKYDYEKRCDSGVPRRPRVRSEEPKERKAAIAAAVAARQQIAWLPPRSLTAEIFGDPRPGQSALDKRQAEASSIRSISLAGQS
jgi:hypothetical protein